MSTYPGAPNLGKLLQYFQAISNQIGYDIYNLPNLANWLLNVSAGYLQNGVGSVALISGGSGYVSPTITVPLPVTAPSGSVPATITVTNTGGVLSAPVVTNSGSGYGCTTPSVIIGDSAGTGASISVAPLNTDNVYNFMPSQATTIQTLLAPMFNAIGSLLQGSVQSTAAVNTFTIAGGGTGYAVNDIITGVLAGLVGFQIKVLTLGASNSVATASLYAGGYNAATASGISATGGTGSGCTLNITSTIGIIRSGQGFNFQGAMQQWTGFVTTS